MSSDFEKLLIEQIKKYPVISDVSMQRKSDDKDEKVYAAFCEIKQVVARKLQLEIPGRKRLHIQFFSTFDSFFQVSVSNNNNLFKVEGIQRAWNHLARNKNILSQIKENSVPSQDSSDSSTDEIELGEKLLMKQKKYAPNKMKIKKGCGKKKN